MLIPYIRHHASQLKYVRTSGIQILKKKHLKKKNKKIGNIKKTMGNGVYVYIPIDSGR